MSFDVNKLRGLLPALYQMRDDAQAVLTPGLLEPVRRTRLATLLAQHQNGPALTTDEARELADLQRAALAGPLVSLLGVFAEQIAVLEEDLDQLYDDQFIETCADWVAPYIGDLVGYRPLHGVAPAISSPRAEVAHTIAFRRRKGTLAVLEDLARDVTGWRARAVEFFTLLVTTQNVNHRRPANHAAPDLRRWEPLERLGTAFDSIPRTVDVRRIGRGRGRHNLPNVGIFLHRIDAQPLRGSPTVAVPGDERRRRFHPLGLDQPLYTRPASAETLTHLATPLDVPLPISRRVLAARLAAYYTDAQTRRSLALRVGTTLVDANRICVCNLADHGATWAHVPDDKFAIDPELGRLTVPLGVSSGEVRVDFHYGFGAALGGGEYGRSFSDPDRPIRLIEVPGPEAATITEALALLATWSPDDENETLWGIVEIQDSGRYEETFAIDVPAGGHIELRAASGCRPAITLGDDLVMTGAGGSEITLDGLLISSKGLRAPADGNQLARLFIRHSTLVPGLTVAADGTPGSPGSPSLVVQAPELAVSIERSILGAVVADPLVTVALTDTILDATDKTRVAYAASTDGSPGGALTLSATTVIGKVSATQLPLVTNSILVAELVDDGWRAPVIASRRQQGCVRTSFVPADAHVPRRYRCLPESAADPAAATPAFTSLCYGSPEYGQLGPATGAALLTAADDEGQPGAFHFLYQPQRETNLWVRLAEYLRVSLEAGILHAS